MTDKTAKSVNNRFLVPVLFSFMVFLCLAVGLWPFDFARQNGARLDGSSLAFASRGISYACSDSPLFPSGDFTATLSVEPEKGPVGGAGELISFHDGARLILSAFQWKEHLIVRSGAKEYETGAKYVLPGKKRTLITVTAGQDGIWIYADGKKTVKAGGTEKPFHGLERTTCITLGNAPDGKRPWKGRFYSLTMIDGAFSPDEVLSAHQGALSGKGLATAEIAGAYLFIGQGNIVKGIASNWPDIEVPERFRAVHKVFLAPIPGLEKLKENAVDVLINFTGFIPFGILYILMPFGGRGVWKALAAIAAGFFLSLAIESAQVFLPGRFSQLSDLVLNTAGAGVGALASHHWRKTISRLID